MQIGCQFRLFTSKSQNGIVQNMDWTGLDNWTGQLDWTVGLDSWTGQLDWTVGLDNWTGQLDWTIGLDFEWDFFHSIDAI